MQMIVPFICGFLSRLDGVGERDRFLKFFPCKIPGINYMRYAIGLFVWAVTMDPVYILTYGAAASIPWGEKHEYMKHGLLSWMIIGYIWGMASLSFGYAVWMMALVTIAKWFEIDQSYFEFFVIGMGSTLWVWFK